VNGATRTAVAASAVAFALTACGDDKPQPAANPAPARSSAVTIATPGDYPDVTVVCDGTTRVYVTEFGYKAGSGVAVIPDDPRCGATSTPGGTP
jgi:expansin (peptidoglycan-binding protein)